MALKSSGRLALVAMEYHQGCASWLTDNPEWRADDWTRPEFQENSRSAWARDGLASWLVNWREGVSHAKWILQRAEDKQAGAGALSRWLDSLLYGGGMARCPRDEWESIQLTADQMARADFCRMNFAALAARVQEADVDAVPMT